MMTQQLAIISFLKPDWRKILLFVVFTVIAVGGQIQAWVFDDNPQTKPPLYDLLRPLPLWFVWIMSMLPLIILSSPLVAIKYWIRFAETGLDVALLWRIGLVVYYYLLSCLLTNLVDLSKRRFNR